jgi:sec-independent protein translocase protein TatA
MNSLMLGEIIGPDILVILAIVALLFGGSRIPQLARSLGSASREFKKGLEDGDSAPHEASLAEKDAPGRPS